jgi:uncharacterized membrane protein YfcA
MTLLAQILLFVVAFAAGVQNALAGGGSFLTFPALLLTGMDARAANITSTVALFPGQVTTGIAGRRFVAGTPQLGVRALLGISLGGGVLGALLLLATPASFFERLVPYLVLFATSVFAWGSFVHRPGTATARLGRGGSALAQLAISIYGGYFGGGIGFLMLAALTIAGMAVRAAAATKNVLAAAMNASAVAIFLFSGEVHWTAAIIAGVAAIGGGQVGAWLLRRVNERKLKIAVVCVGVALTVGLFARSR